MENIGQSIAERLPEIKVPEAVARTGEVIHKTVTDGLAEFSSRAVLPTQSSATDFLSANGAVAKIVFVLLVLIIFIVMFKVGLTLIGYFTTQNTNPYVVSGLIPGNIGIVIDQDTAVKTAVPIPRSNNQATGMEFTWSCWINLAASPVGAGPFHIFNKGNNPDTTDPSNTNHATTITDSPGLYLSFDQQTQSCKLQVTMSEFDAEAPKVITVNMIPIKKWIHVAIRLQNTILDVYVNGTVVERLIFDSVPRQSYGNVNICQNGGFIGQLSDLRYFSSALSVFSIQNIVYWGPNLTPSKLSTAGSIVGSNNTFFGNTWYNNHYK